MKIRFKEFALDTLSYLIVVQCTCWLVHGSEFPERECCDTVYSSPPNPEPVQPTRPTPIHTQIGPSSTSANHTGNKCSPCSVFNCFLK